ncbi:hypothetical protein L1887_38783 [Cichorium endivia]|nr:hypothetical protein L1887_38783 [Cichorium endivia]
MDNQSDESYQENVIDQPLTSEEGFDVNHDEDCVSNFNDEHQSVDLNQENVNNIHDEDDPVDLNQHGNLYIPECPVPHVLKPESNAVFHSLDAAIQIYKTYALEAGYHMRKTISTRPTTDVDKEYEADEYHYDKLMKDTEFKVIHSPSEGSFCCSFYQNGNDSLPECVPFYQNGNDSLPECVPFYQNGNDSLPECVPFYQNLAPILTELEGHCPECVALY